MTKERSGRRWHMAKPMKLNLPSRSCGVAITNNPTIASNTAEKRVLGRRCHGEAGRGERSADMSFLLSPAGSIVGFALVMLSVAKHLGKLCETLRFTQGDKLET